MTERKNCGKNCTKNTAKNAAKSGAKAKQNDMPNNGTVVPRAME